jgi:hypothetical protein
MFCQLVLYRLSVLSLAALAVGRGPCHAADTSTRWRSDLRQPRPGSPPWGLAVVSSRMPSTFRAPRPSPSYSRPSTHSSRPSVGSSHRARGRSIPSKGSSRSTATGKKSKTYRGSGKASGRAGVKGGRSKATRSARTGPGRRGRSSSRPAGRGKSGRSTAKTSRPGKHPHASGKTVGRGKSTRGASKSGHRGKAAKGSGKVAGRGKSTRRRGPPNSKRGGGKFTKYRRRPKSRGFDPEDPASIFGNRKPPKFSDFTQDKFLKAKQWIQKQVGKAGNLFDKVFSKRKTYDVPPLTHDAASKDESKSGGSKLTFDEAAKKEADFINRINALDNRKGQFEAEKTKLEKTFKDCLATEKAWNFELGQKGQMTLLEVLSKNNAAEVQCYRNYKKALDNLLKKYEEESSEAR